MCETQSSTIISLIKYVPGNILKVYAKFYNALLKFLVEQITAYFFKVMYSVMVNIFYDDTERFFIIIGAMMFSQSAIPGRLRMWNLPFQTRDPN